MSVSAKRWAAAARRIRRPSRLVAWLICLGALSTGPATAQTQAPLPGAAQNLLEQGVAAGREANYPLALRFLEDARKAAPNAPIIHLNLGLAESKMPGRELRSTAWFGAYLAVAPDAANAGAVKAEISALKARRRANMARLIAAAQDAAKLIPEADSEARESAWGSIAIDQALQGDIAAADKAARLVKSSRFRTQVATRIADAQISAGDTAGARRTLEGALRSAGRIASEPQTGVLTPAGAAGEAYAYIAKAQAQAGNLSGAFSTADRTPGLGWKATAQTLIGEVQARAGDALGARKTFTAAGETIGLMVGPDDNPAYQDYLRTKIAQAQAGGTDPAPQVTCLPFRAGAGVKASDWVAILMDSVPAHDCPLNNLLFVDLSGYLNTLHQQYTRVTFDTVEPVLRTLLTVGQRVDGMLARQLGP